MTKVEDYKEHFDRLQAAEGGEGLATIRSNAFAAFNRMGIPTARHEEWKYTRIGTVFNREYQFPADRSETPFALRDLDAIRLPGHEEANELVFINGLFSFPFSSIRSGELVVQPLADAAKNEHSEFVATHLGHSANYLQDGINALNTAFVNGGVFILVKKGKITEHPVYIYNITDARSSGILAQPRTLVKVEENAAVKMVETYATLGSASSFINQVMEVVVEQDARVEYYKIQNDVSDASLVSTTHFRQVGKSFIHTVTISLNGGIVRNNLNVVLEAERCESHLYGLYFQGGQTHIDNHTIVDNAKPGCYSNELYKGVMNDEASAVFNGKIYVRKDAQKTNAYQSNKNVLLTNAASVNTKPQLEIFADDVKCSHGCTIGLLDEDALFYLQSRGIGIEMARALLVRSFASDIFEHILLAPVKSYVEQLISKRLENGVS